MCLVFDFGGGTLDISVLKIEGEVIETISTAGDVYLGGADFDNKILQICMDKISEDKPGFDWQSTKGKRATLRLKQACKEAKGQL